MEDEFLTLRKLLEQLKTRIDEAIADRMTDDTPMRTIDRLEAVAVKYIGQVDSVIGLAESYMPDMIDAELILEIVIPTTSEVDEAEAMFKQHQQMKEAMNR